MMNENERYTVDTKKICAATIIVVVLRRDVESEQTKENGKSKPKFVAAIIDERNINKEQNQIFVVNVILLRYFYFILG